MLRSLYIKDYALIEKIFIEFDKGLNIITGETGAGKSIIIDAMSLLLGERATQEVIRKGADRAVVEGIFDVSKNKKVENLLHQNEIDFSNDLIVRRELSLKGSNRCFVNDSPVNLNFVKEIGNLLVDLHGQHEHQSLLRSETHIEFLDEFCDIDNDIKIYQTEFKSLNIFLKELNDYNEKEKALKGKEDLFRFQLNEILAVNPNPNEDEEITSQLKILENSERLLELTNKVFDDLYDKENSTYDTLTKVKSSLTELNKIDTSFSEALDEATTAQQLLSDITQFVRDYKSKIDLDPENLESLRERLASINLLKKKFGGTLKSVLELKEKIEAELIISENFEEYLKSLIVKINAQQKVCGELAAKISIRRNEQSKTISKNIVSTLKTLGIENGKFEVRIEQSLSEKNDLSCVIINNKFYVADEKGIDKVGFFISTNVGEDLKPLAKVASGGEVSRIMLALKSILAKGDKLPLLIFDEIDSGISGRIAQKVGQELKSLSTFHQIIAITHLPQIAGLSDSHFSVVKSETNERVQSSIRKLNYDEKVREVAKLLSGENVTETSLNSAKELMNKE